MNPEDPGSTNDKQLHHQVFAKLRDAGPDSANAVASLYGLSESDVKALCRQAAGEILEQRGHLHPYEETVRQWAEQ
ncbi:hypothetical protein FOZ76_22185 [Verticiella sediminum]|uniref:Uncharacterized protein n=1 Tax=Verticiella sediminum TaxID=1247510 RepID=A0A556ACA9_9BURK|nr:hypothetical protein [Verticiella sediminum]TSH90521.1 hypothetical protein FOZ76_22185 [Verticiella sediminum]